jgi:spore maturation protein CgeB
MNILIVGKFYAEGFATHIAETFAAMGHTVTRFAPGFKQRQAKGKFDFRFQQLQNQLYQFYTYTSRYTDKRLKEIKKIIATNEPDLVLACHDFLLPAEVAWLKKNTKAVVAMWFPDAMSNFSKAMFLNAPYDFLFFKEPFAVNILKSELGLNAYYLPECCNPQYHHKVSLTDKDIEKYSCDIATAGNLHTARAALFGNLDGYKVKIWGNPAPRWMDTRRIDKMICNEFVSNEEKAKAFLGAKIVINNIHPTEYLGINARTYEIAGCGGFQLVNNRAGLQELFLPGEEIVVYETVKELKEKIELFLNDPQERNRIAENGYKRAHKDHTYEIRLNLMLETIFGNAQGFKSGLIK